MTAATQPPIADYALLSDSQGAALVSRGGSIDWACLPRFDSPATFARLLGDDGGHWRISPTEPFETTRAYLTDTMVLRSEFRTASGTVAVTRAQNRPRISTVGSSGVVGWRYDSAVNRTDPAGPATTSVSRRRDRGRRWG